MPVVRQISQLITLGLSDRWRRLLSPLHISFRVLLQVSVGRFEQTTENLDNEMEKSRLKLKDKRRTFCRLESEHLVYTKTDIVPFNASVE
jgi:hypothetical protein